MNIEKIKSELLSKLEGVKNITDLNNVKSEFLGKKGAISKMMKDMKNLSIEEKKELGKTANELKSFISDKLEEKRNNIEAEELRKRLESEYLDITLPVRDGDGGKLHPISKVAHEMFEIFADMGFDIATGPQLEDDFHCFGALNIPADHPARQMQDTFYMPDKENGEKMVLRTHTSSVQIRHMENSESPFKIIAPGRVYRYDYDATHTPMFHQMEGLYIDKNINMGHLKGCLLEFFKRFFSNDELKINLRPSHFPFTEPSAEVDVSYFKKDGQIVIGNGDKWLEVLGCGMVHPNVLKSVGVDPDEYQGFAFGMGIERMAMLKYGINDLRKMFDGDIRFLKHYGFKFFE